MNVNIFDQVKILFKHGSFLIGFLFLAFGGIMSFFIILEADFSKYKYWFMSVETTIGFVDYVDYTSVEVNEQPLLEFGYIFSDPETKESFRGVSYDTYRSLSQGDSVSIEYLVSDPYTSRIEGMDSGLVPMWVVLLVLIFPTVGFLVCIPGVKKTRHQTNVLKNGVLTKAQLVREEPTNTTINDRRVIKFIFAYQVNGNGYETSVSTHLYEEITDDPEEELIYHKDNPRDALIVDDLPYSIREKVWEKMG